jgi:hypothetical protein
MLPPQEFALRADQACALQGFAAYLRFATVANQDAQQKPGKAILIDPRVRVCSKG